MGSTLVDKLVTRSLKSLRNPRNTYKIETVSSASSNTKKLVFESFKKITYCVLGRCMMAAVDAP
jgi:hypothetical protein